ncbi:MAG: glycoside hydrolase family 2 protein [Prevotella salivae]|uniref:glycoside hydrolase family 2 TIM barrel-domain containing protein n=1 Tax=Segatella salivae TaxID=228604 RepID=UPI001CAEFECE|nr:glycoside hydrolase family 2 TIM barrel-domain containing protein [Segatella salivae]MBF1524123.1 glycoside hydrolase family 2 protein [Segatella salivae]
MNPKRISFFRFAICSLLLLPLFLCVKSYAFERHLWDEGWRFALHNDNKAHETTFDDHAWRVLDLPHDWAIEGDFYALNPSGANGGALPGGIGWYRKHLNLNDNDASSRYVLHFDGAYMNTSVYVNGQLVGVRPYGFISFSYDITPYLKKQGDNVVAVKVDNSKQPNSRWYTGCGIYRHVYLMKSSDIRIEEWGVQALTEVKKGKGKVNLNTKIENPSGRSRRVIVHQTLWNKAHQMVSKASKACQVEAKGATISQLLNVNKPQLWSLESPNLYTVTTEIEENGRILDRDTISIGLRNVAFDVKKGFFLNGKNIKINGVCLHGDLGCLGTAINEDALYRQLLMMKDMGVNAIRCSHNPPAPELLNLCDSMGLLVMDEAFDSWMQGKTTYDYSIYFKTWAERDLRDMVLRDRNHPSIILWSIGNEVLEQWNKTKSATVALEDVNILLNNSRDKTLLSTTDTLNASAKLTQFLASIVRRYDPTRLISAGCNEVSPNNNLFKSGALDVIGFNYHQKKVADVPQNFPGKPFIMTETVSALHTRGYYRMPSDSLYRWPTHKRPFTEPSFMCSSYDNSCAYWGSTHEQTWDIVKHTPYCSGQFIWTGFDYIGEPTPFNFPARSSYFGIVDLAGFPKDVYYLYQSEWTNKPVLHVFPHWNWIEGQAIDLWCYYNQADEVELFINGKSQGVRKKSNEHEYHVAWHVTYEPGEVRVVARKNGKQVNEKTIRTAGAPHHIRLTPNHNVLKANGRSLSFVTVEVVDKEGNLCPWADQNIQFTLTGEGKIAGVDNGSPFSLERFQANSRHAFFGKCMVVVQAGKAPSVIKLTAKGVDLQPQTIEIKSE